MPGRTGLFEFLSVEVGALTATDSPPNQGTVLTHSSNETYDDDAGLGSMMIWSESTLYTRTHDETYDDDPGVSGLGDLSGVDTDQSGVQRVLDAGESHAGRIPEFETTVFTKVVGETHDDDGLSLQLDV